MLRSKIKQWLVKAWTTGKQVGLKYLENLSLPQKRKRQLVQAWKRGKQVFIEYLEKLKTYIKEIVGMPLDTKITMLGTTGTGKTCYMIGMSMYMQGKGVNGFTITSEKHDQFMNIRRQWNNMKKKEGAERWPAGNADVPIEYSFNFNYGGETFAKFDWLDYRGGALPDSEESTDRKALVDRLITSDCLFLCISAEYIALAEEDSFEALMEAEVGTMNALLRDIYEKVKPTRENPFPVAIVVTKADLLANFNGSIQAKGADIVKEFFENTLFVSPHWLTAIIPVTLGQELAQNKDSGRIKPVGVHLPVTFAVLCKLIKERIGRSPKADLRTLLTMLNININQPDINTQIQKLDEELTNILIYKGNSQIYSVLNM